MPTLSGAYDSINVPLRNRNWSWSGRNEATGVVAINVHESEYDTETGLVEYEPSTEHDPSNRTGFKFRQKDLQYAKEHCDGIVRVVLHGRTRNVPNEHGTNWRALPQPFKIIDHNTDTGAYKLQRANDDSRAKPGRALFRRALAALGSLSFLVKRKT